MKVTNLRIGNYIYKIHLEYNHETDDFDCPRPEESDVVVVDMNLLQEVDNTNRYFTGYDYDPILLTEEWFNKFNAQSDGISFWWIEYSSDNGTVFYLSVGHFKDGFFYLPTGDLKIRGVKLEYVHQLQNLYYALTGEELAITNGTA